MAKKYKRGGLKKVGRLGGKTLFVAKTKFKKGRKGKKRHHKKKSYKSY